MKLLRLRVAHWKHLPAIEFPFADGVTVIHGPNKTGKSSLADAFRRGMFDKHKGKADDLVPWSSPDAVPEVEIEFESDGRRYLVEKKFSKLKAGGSDLWELVGGDRRRIATGPDVEDEVRKLLRSAGKNTGVPEMLWVRQGAVDMPAVDEEFAGRLRGILSAITPTPFDERVRKLIAERLAPHFTDSVMKSKSFFSPDLDPARLEPATLKKLSATAALSKLQDQIAQRQKALGEIEAELASFERDMAAAEDARDRLSVAAMATHQAEKELQDLTADETRIEDKRRQAEKSGRELDDARQRLAGRRREQEEFAACARELDACAGESRARKAEVDVGREEYARRKAGRDREKEAIRELNDRLRGLRDAAMIDARQSLVDATAELEQLGERQARARRLEEEKEQAAALLAAIVVPPPRNAKRINDLLTLVTRLSARLDAGQLRVGFLPERDLEITLTHDRGPTETLSARAGEQITRLARQDLTLAIPGVGRFEVGRGEEDKDLEKMADELADARRELTALLSTLGIDPGSSAAEIITELQRRRERLEGLQRKIAEKEEEWGRLGGVSSAVLAGEVSRLAQQRDNLIGSRAGLADWQPSRAALAEEKKALAGRTSAMEDELARVAERLALAETEMERAAERQQKVGEASTLADAQRKVRQDQMDALVAQGGSPEKLAGLVAAAERELADLGRDHERLRLTPEEEKFSERLRAARALVDSRKDYERQLRTDLEVLRERLRGLEGRDPARKETQARLDADRREATRLETSLKAHAILAQLFDRIRDDSVESSLKPVTEQVEPWLRELYGAEAKSIVFGDGLQAEAIRTAHGDCTRREGFESVTSHGELEQLATLVRLAYGVVLARQEPQLIILDDPLAHSDPQLLRRMNAVIEDAARKNLQVLIFTCNRENFDRIAGARVIDLAARR